MINATDTSLELAGSESDHPEPDSSELAVLAESKLTERYQTTLPAPVRKVLGLAKHDKVAYRLSADGQVYIARLESEESDPVLAKFATFLAKDMAQNPQNVKPIKPELIAEAQSLVAGMDSDLDAALSEEDE